MRFYSYGGVPFGCLAGNGEFRSGRCRCLVLEEMAALARSTPRTLRPAVSGGRVCAATVVARWCRDALLAALQRRGTSLTGHGDRPGQSIGCDASGTPGQVVILITCVA